MEKIVKYYVNDVTLYYYCKINNLKYENISFSIRYYVKKNESNFILNDIIVYSIKRYIDRRNKKIILKQSSDLRNNIEISLSETKAVCKQLNLSSKNIIFISKTGYSTRSIIILMYYCASKTNKAGNRIMETRCFQKLIKKFKEKKLDDIKTSILLYLANIEVDKNQVFGILNDGFIIRKAKKFVRSLNILQHYLEDIVNDCYIYVFDLIDRLLPYEKEQIFKYIHIILNSKASEIYQNYHQKEISLFTKINKNGKETELINYIPA